MSTWTPESPHHVVVIGAECRRVITAPSDVIRGRATD